MFHSLKSALYPNSSKNTPHNTPLCQKLPHRTNITDHRVEIQYENEYQIPTKQKRSPLINREKHHKEIGNRKLGSIKFDSMDIKTRIMKINSAFGRMSRLWLKKAYVSLSMKARLYNACVLAILTYNLSSIEVSNKALQSLLT
jgi:hypothetical protein